MRNLEWGRFTHPEIPLLPPKDRNDNRHLCLNVKLKSARHLARRLGVRRVSTWPEALYPSRRRSGRSREVYQPARFI